MNSIELLRDHFDQKYPTRLLGLFEDSPTVLLVGGKPTVWMIYQHIGSRIMFNSISWSMVEEHHNTEEDVVRWMLSLTYRFRLCDLARPDSLEILESKLALTPGDTNYLGMIRTAMIDM